MNEQIGRIADAIGHEVARRIAIGGWAEDKERNCVQSIAAIVVEQFEAAGFYSAIESRITELQAANTREVERRRKAEQRAGLA